MTKMTQLHPGDPVPALTSVSDGEITELVIPPRGARVTISRGTHDAICRLYDDLRDQAPPEDSHQERAAAVAARARARQYDWPAPAALDDDLIDDPAYLPRCGWLPATLTGVPQRPVPVSSMSLSAPIAPRRVAARPVRVTADQ